MSSQIEMIKKINMDDVCSRIANGCFADCCYSIWTDHPHVRNVIRMGVEKMIDSGWEDGFLIDDFDINTVRKTIVGIINDMGMRDTDGVELRRRSVGVPIMIGFDYWTKSDTDEMGADDGLTSRVCECPDLVIIFAQTEYHQVLLSGHEVGEYGDDDGFQALRDLGASLKTPLVWALSSSDRERIKHAVSLGDALERM